MTKASLGVIAVTIATILTLFLWPFTPRLAVRTVTIERGDLIQSSRLEGVVAYQEQQPAVSLQAGVLKAVHVRQGQQVQAGQLLFSLDTAPEEQALAALAANRHNREQALQSCDQPALTALAADSLSLMEKELALRQSIAAKQLRASRDGRVEAVYVREGQIVTAGALLGVVRSEEKCVTAMCRAGEAPLLGTAALVSLGNDVSFPARLTSVGVPQQSDAGFQQICFEPLNATILTDPGQRTVVEMIREVEYSVPLAPLEAFDSADRLWVVTEGIAAPVSVDTSRRNAESVRVPESLLGARIILAPEGSGVTSGRAVKEAKVR